MTQGKSEGRFVGRHNVESLQGSKAFAQDLAALLREGDIVALNGTLGRGKTTLARFLINALPPAEGEALHEEVPSPTFSLVQCYDRAPFRLWHFDLYRLESPKEAYEIGLEEALNDGVILIEWPERLGGLLPDSALWIDISVPHDEGEDEVTSRRCYDLWASSATLAQNWRTRLARLFDFSS